MKKLACRFKKLFSLPGWLLFLLVFVLILRIPSFFHPYVYGDECIYLTLGEAVKRGLVLYRDIHDNKPPLLYLLAAASSSLFWFRVILGIWNLVTIYLFFLLAKNLFLAKKKLIFLATTVFALLTTLPFLEGNIANAEIFMALPSLAGIFLILCGKNDRFWRFLVAGVLFSLASLFKVPAAFDFAAAFVFLLLFQETEFFGGTKSKIKVLFILVAGFLLPILATFVYYWSHGALFNYLVAAFLQNFGYLSSWQTGSHSDNFLQGGLAQRGLILLGFVGILFWTRKKMEKKFLLVLLLFGFSLFAALLPQRPYPHYLIQVAVPLSLLVAFIFESKKLLRLTSVAMVFVFSVVFLSLHFWYYPTLPYYRNFISFALGEKTKDEFFSTFGKEVNRNYQIAQFLNSHTAKNEKIFIWGDSPCLYALSRRLPTGRYTASYHIIDFNGFNETLKTLKEQKPRFIIDLQNENRPFPNFPQFLEKNYFLLKEENGAKIFFRRPSEK